MVVNGCGVGWLGAQRGSAADDKLLRNTIGGLYQNKRFGRRDAFPCRTRDDDEHTTMNEYVRGLYVARTTTRIAPNTLQTTAM